MARVYLITNGESYKIGVAGNIAQRFRQLSTASDSHLDLIALSHEMPKDHAHFLERSIHKSLRQYRRRGEWFTLPDFMADILIGQIQPLQNDPKDGANPPPPALP